MTPNRDTGTKIGHLTIISKSSPAHWICKCVCGKEVRMPNHRLNAKYKISCGCQQGVHKGGRIWDKDTNDGLIHKTYTFNASRYSRTWNITNELFVSSIHSQCHYCGVQDALGLDRMDNEGGYEPNNIVPCCAQCNFAKGKQAYNEFILLCHRISHNHRRTIISP